jgi:hypothetical protein
MRGIGGEAGVARYAQRQSVHPGGLSIVKGSERGTVAGGAPAQQCGQLPITVVTRATALSKQTRTLPH